MVAHWLWQQAATGRQSCVGAKGGRARLAIGDPSIHKCMIQGHALHHFSVVSCVFSCTDCCPAATLPSGAHLRARARDRAAIRSFDLHTNSSRARVSKVGGVWGGGRPPHSAGGCEYARDIIRLDPATFCRCWNAFRGAQRPSSGEVRCLTRARDETHERRECAIVSESHANICELLRTWLVLWRCCSCMVPTCSLHLHGLFSIGFAGL